MVADAATIISFVTLVLMKLLTIPLPSELLTLLKILSRIIRGFFYFSNDLLASHESLHGTIYKEQSDYFCRVFHPEKAGSCDEFPRSERTVLP